MTSDSTPTEGATFHFGRRSTRGILLGLSQARLTALTIAFLVGLVAVYVGGMTALAWTTPVWGAAAASAYVPVADRRAVEWLPVYGHWLLRRALRQNMYGVRVLRPRPAGSLALPGDAARLRLHHDTVTGAAMVHDPHAGTLTAVAAIRHPSFVLLSPGEQDRRVAAWGRALATCCASGRLARVQVLQRSLPDSGHDVLTHWVRHRAPGDSWQSRQYVRLLEAAAPTAERHETTISISLDLGRARRDIRAEGGRVPGAAAVLRREMTSLAGALRTAQITVTGWLNPEELAVMLRTAYDPAATSAFDRSGSSCDPSTAGPVVVEEHLDHLLTDSGVHAVYWISQWPRAQVHAGFLSPVLLAAGLRRSFTLVAQPVTPADAARAVRRERVAYHSDATNRARLGALPDAAADQEWADVTQRERELLAGHSDLRYAGFLVVTAANLEGLLAAKAQIEQAAIQAGCETRLLLGQQAQAFAAAALPLGRGI